MKTSASLRFLHFTVAVIALFLLGACNKNENLFDENLDPLYEDLRGTYYGTAICKMEYLDDKGNVSRIEVANYNIFFTTGKNSSALTPNDPNPFHLYVNPIIGEILEGRINISSSQGKGRGRETPSQEFHFWDIEYKNGEVSGILVNTYEEETFSKEFNTIRTLNTYGMTAEPKKLAVGTSLYGHLDKEKVNITVKGQTTDGLVRFEYQLNAEKDN